MVFNQNWLSDWKKRVKLTLDSDKVDSALSNFPILITLASDVGINNKDVTNIFDELGSNSKKMAVTTSDGTTQCFVETERWDNGNNVAWLWTKVPTIDASVGTILYLYYDSTKDDNTTYVGDPTSTPGKNVWDSNFKGVWHMSQDPNGDVADAIKDSTSNTNHGSPAGTMTTADLVDGKVGKAIEFDASDDRINVGDESSLEPSHLTFSYWAKPTTYDRSLNGGIAKGTIFGSSSGYSYRIDFNNGNAVGRVTDEGNSWYGTTVAIGDNDWHLWTLTYDGTKVCLWKDLTKHEGSTFSGTIGYIKTYNDFCIGAAPNGNYSFDGIIDDVRVSNIARSGEWIKTTYYSSEDNLISYGNEQLYPPGYISGTVYDKYGFQMQESCNVIVSDLDGELVDFATTSGDGTFNIPVPAPFDERFIVTFFREGSYRLDNDMAGAIFLTPVVSGTG